jgi:solute carrier family 25 (mitochondrial aspartate/glutamate transporter), member 12/13
MSTAPQQAVLAPTRSGSAAADLVRNIIIGGSAGVIGQTVVYPMYNVKTRLHTEPTRYRHAAHCIRKVVQHEGVRGLYRGLPPAFFGVFFEKAIKLTANDAFRKRLAAPDGSVSLLKGVTAGAGAGLCQVVVTNPMEMVMITMQTRSAQGRKPKSMTRVIQGLGLPGLYRGTVSTLARDVPFSAVFFSLREYMNLWFADETGKTPKRGIFAGGLASGCIAATISTPMDVIKTSLMAESGARNAQPAAPMTIRMCANIVYKTQGIAGFFNGVGPRLLIISPLFGITMFFYEIFGEQTTSKK